MTSWPYLTRMYETVHKMSLALESVRRVKSQEQAGVVGASLLSRRKCAGGGGGLLVQDGVCVSLEQREEAVESVKAALTL